MRPLRLAMTAFGPFVGEQILDFTELGEREFFLIHGPTGAGKTSLLDGLCFALYGDSSGQERAGKHLRSDFASPETQTEVVFDFALGSRKFRVRRRPEQPRAKKRTTGTTLAPPEATLWKLTQEGPIPLAEGVNDVTMAISELLGFRSDQFRQVVMLPQGRFETFLKARPSDREAILEALFQTEPYRLLQEFVERRARDGVAELKLREAARAAELAGAPDAPALRALAAEAEAAAGAAAEDIRSLDQDRARAQAELSSAQLGARDFAEARAAAEALARVLAKQDEMKARASELDAARRAAPLEARERHVREREEEAKIAQARALELVTKLAATGKARDEAEARLRDETARAPARESARGERLRLEGLRLKVERLAELRAAAAKAAFAEQSSRQSQVQAEKSLQALAEGIARGEKLQAALQAAAARAPALEAATQALARAHDLAANLAAAKRAHDQDRSSLALAKEAETAAATAREETARSAEATRESWLAGQASALANQLRHGEACAVCGSTEHPAPARPAAGAPDRSTVEAAALRAREAETRLAGAREAVAGKAAAEAQSASRVSILDEQNRAQDAQFEASYSQLSPNRADFAQFLATARKATADLAALESTLAAERAARAQAESAAQTARDGNVKARVDRAAADTQLAEASADIPELLREPAALDHAIIRAVRASEVLDAAFDKARTASAQAEKELATQTQSEASARAAAAERATAAATSTRELTTALAEQGFRTADDFRKSRRAAAEIDALHGIVTQYDATQRASRERDERAKAAIQDRLEPDLKPLQEKTQALENLWKEKTQERARHLSKALEISARAKKVEALDAELATQGARHRILGRVSDVLNGKKPYLLKFQQFVLTAFLEDVLAVASRRLDKMSRGRFQFQRKPGSALDLEIRDEHTGTQRPVASLSGGETFLASLSLALGLAEVVTSYSGGTHLDAIFVDEGFGTLDPDALDLAITALSDLQQGGRMVGIISHVQELKERIATRLEVIPDSKGGSRARFVL